MGAAIIPAISAGIGLIQNQDASRRQRNAQNRANDLNERGIAMQEDQYYGLTKPALERIFSLANNYDPAREAQTGIDYAKSTTEDTISKTLARLRASAAAGGATPGQSSEYGVRATGMTNRAADPLRAYAAQAMGNPTQQRIQMLIGALGQAPAGGVSNAYFNAASNAASLGGPGGDFGPSSQLLSQALQELFRKKGGGAGGSGDFRGNEMGMVFGGDQ